MDANVAETLLVAPLSDQSPRFREPRKDLADVDVISVYSRRFPTETRRSIAASVRSGAGLASSSNWLDQLDLHEREGAHHAWIDTVRRASRTSLVLLWLLAVSAAPAAQDFRGLIEGKVTDNTGGAVPGVTVTIVNAETNVPSTAVTNESGNYTAPFLTPGIYTVTVELQGFKKSERKGVEVRVGDRLALDFKLEVGGVEETITVASTTPLLETRTASAGQVIDEKRIALMPLSDGNPFVLARLATGVAYTGDLKFSRPFDNGGTSAVTADGARRRQRVHARRLAQHGQRPPRRVHAAGRRRRRVQGRDRDVRRAAGPHRRRHRQRDDEERHEPASAATATTTIATRSSSANDFFLERAGRPKDQLDYKRYGFNVGGPVRLGGLYNGRDRTFFFSSVEWLYDKFPEPGQFTVPTEAQRNGDFSALLAQGIRIYDPATARLVNGRVERAAVPEQHHPGEPHQPDRAARS